MNKYTSGKKTIRPTITCFAIRFLQLESILKQKQTLKNKFDYDEYTYSKYAKDKLGGVAYEGKKIVMSTQFWNKATKILKVFEPIVNKVIKLVDGDDKPTVEFLYEEGR